MNNKQEIKANADIKHACTKFSFQFVFTVKFLFTFLLISDKDCYPMCHSPRGLCCIINNMDFRQKRKSDENDGVRDRNHEGSTKDAGMINDKCLFYQRHHCKTRIAKHLRKLIGVA